jgi:hypothetical protein
MTRRHRPVSARGGAGDTRAPAHPEDSGRALIRGLVWSASETVHHPELEDHVAADEINRRIGAPSRTGGPWDQELLDPDARLFTDVGKVRRG